MAEPRLTPKHLAAPRKLILLVRINQKGEYEACTLAGEVALVGKSRDEIKEKMRLQVRQMKASVRPTTVRLHFIADQRTWLHAPLPEEAEDGGPAKQSPDERRSSEQTPLRGTNQNDVQSASKSKTNDTSSTSKSSKK